MGREIMAARQINESPALFAMTGFVLLAQPRQRGLGQRGMAAVTFRLENSNHRLFVLGLEPVVGGDKVRWNFTSQRLGLFRERDLRMDCPAMSQKSFGPIQRNQFGGDPVHGLFLVRRLARFRFGHLGHRFQRAGHVGFHIFSFAKPRQPGQAA